MITPMTRATRPTMPLKTGWWVPSCSPKPGRVDPEGTTGLPVGCLVGGYYLPRPKDQRGGAVVLQGNDRSHVGR